MQHLLKEVISRPLSLVMIEKVDIGSCDDDDDG